MTLSNAQTAAAFAAVKAAIAAGKADATLTDRARDLRDAGFKSADIAGKGQHFGDFQRLVAETALTSKQLATWSNTELASKVRDKSGKQTNTARGLLVDRVNSIVKRVRDRLAKLENEPADASKGKAKGKSTGAGKAKRSSTEVFFATIDDYIKKFGGDDASDKFDFDPKIARAALVKLIKELK